MRKLKKVVVSWKKYWNYSIFPMLVWESGRCHFIQCFEVIGSIKNFWGIFLIDVFSLWVCVLIYRLRIGSLIVNDTFTWNLQISIMLSQSLLDFYEPCRYHLNVLLVQWPFLSEHSGQLVEMRGSQVYLHDTQIRV